MPMRKTGKHQSRADQIENRRKVKQAKSGKPRSS